jgi:hypothetical protein
VSQLILNEGVAPATPASGKVTVYAKSDGFVYSKDDAGTETALKAGTVTSVSVVTANGVSGSVATSTTTPAITLSLAAITPTTVTPSGLVDISGAAAGQIKFPATQNASADANTLDDYEEGTFTPTVTASSGTFTSVSGTGRYTKVGRQVFISGEVTITTAGTAVGGILVTLPFTNAASIAAIGVCRERALTGVMATAQLASGGAQISIIKYDNTTIIASGNIVAYGLTFNV